jgi:hypothetical protein
MRWTSERIREGFERFRNEHGRVPKAVEIDQLEYLPSSRWIEVKFGGLEKLRAELGYEDTHFGKGAYRSQIAHRVNGRGREAELVLESFLRVTFGEVCVHTEKMFGPSKCRVDFFVYAPEGNFGIDIFYSDTLRTLQSNVNIKMHKYAGFPGKLYLVAANTAFVQEELDTYAAAKTIALPKNVELVTLSTITARLARLRAYPNLLAT